MRQLLPPHTLRLLLVGALVAAGLNACSDRCLRSVTNRIQRQYFITSDELRTSIGSLPARDLERPGKIYVRGPYLFINELKKGIHILDNRNPATPRMLGFLNIPGNTDIAVRGNVLYADSFVDFLAFDITEPTNVRLVKRVENAFPDGSVDGLHWKYDFNRKVITDYRYEWVTETKEADCDDPTIKLPYYGYHSTFNYSSMAGGDVAKANYGGSSGNPNGQGGSMARFALHDRYLYAVTPQNLQLFDVNQSENPVALNKISLGFGIETIFPYRDKLFIGTTTGMKIMNNANPAKPTELATFAHVRSCDPVVVEGDIAYVTLRGGTACGGFTNQLDVVSVANPKLPVLLKSYPMEGPYGLGIDAGTLFVCEGDKGLKTLRATDPLKIELLSHFKDLHAYDVIPLGGTLLVIGEKGLYQYDYRHAKNLKLLSVMNVKPAAL
jgi:hypothetical protein